MKRKIVKIDPEKCNGCGLCVNACAEGALQIVDGKARLVSESYCDGLGACLPECPTGAITIEEREAAPFDEEAVKKHLESRKGEESAAESSPCPEVSLECGCRGSEVRAIQPAAPHEESPAPAPAVSQLRQWPCQLRLVPVNAPFLEGAHLLIAADCTAYAYAAMHDQFMRGRITLIACPKLDQFDYAAKLAEMLKQNKIKSITVLRMEVPCCGRLVEMVKEALRSAGELIPWRVVTISRDGRIVEEC
ncbi:MAG: 4Fe-4S binding protein [Firmicutes bacterium]|jgi:ferredoxin|nr:4Fe-4S binding protein [Bacillota bacterium]HPU02057.1 4Fe-4S binding protein [Bacillota bacterium]